MPSLKNRCEDINNIGKCQIFSEIFACVWNLSIDFTATDKHGKTWSHRRLLNWLAHIIHGDCSFFLRHYVPQFFPGEGRGRKAWERGRETLDNRGRRAALTVSGGRPDSCGRPPLYSGATAPICWSGRPKSVFIPPQWPWIISYGFVLLPYKFYRVYRAWLWILNMTATIQAHERKCVSVVNLVMNAPSSSWLICPLRNFSTRSICSSIWHLFLPLIHYTGKKVIEKAGGQPCDCPPNESL